MLPSPAAFEKIGNRFRGHGRRFAQDHDIPILRLKNCTYFPYPAKVWVNGHEWAERQAGYAGIDFAALANGFAGCDEPERLQGICDSFGPEHVHGFFDRWIATTPVPFTATDRAAGYWWELSVRQVEASRTLVFDDPRRARGFFDALVADNIGIARPHEVAAVFKAHTRRHPGSCFFYTKIDTRLLRPLIASRPTTRTRRASARPRHHRPSRVITDHTDNARLAPAA